MSRPAYSLPLGLIRAPWFDGWLVLGCTLMALLGGGVAWYYPQQQSVFHAILFADLWLLGSHHVIATYTRLCFDKESFKNNKFFIFGLPWLVVAGIIFALWITGDAVIISTIYLYWQWFHYTRQSYGISRIYGRKAQISDYEQKLTNFVIYGVPLWGILHLSARHSANPGQRFLESHFWAIPVPEWMVLVSGVAAAIGVVLWLFLKLSQLMDGKLVLLPTLYIISHIIIFVTGYWLLGDIHINLGWLVINIWHNAQYILIVWLYNNNRFRKGVTGDARFLSFISQTKFLWLYLIICITFAIGFYAVIRFFSTVVAPTFLPDFIDAKSWVIVAYQGINFHHYIVDGVIWKVRKKETRERLGVEDETPESAVEHEINQVVDG